MARCKQFCEEEALDQAVGLFWKKGYNGTSISDLVERLGVNRASLYATYGGKKELFEKALARYMAQRHAEVRAALETEGARLSGKETIRLFLESVATGSAADPERRGCFAANVTAELAAEDPDVNACLLGNERFFIDTFAVLAARAQEEGDLPADSDPQGVARYLFAFVTGLKLASKTGWDEAALQSALAPAMAVFNPARTVSP